MTTLSFRDSRSLSLRGRMLWSVASLVLAGAVLAGQPLRAQEAPQGAADQAVTAATPVATEAAGPSLPFIQSLAAAAAKDEAVAGYYASTHYQPIWTGAGDAERRLALLEALATATDHGLPAGRYDAAGLMSRLQSARTEGDLGRIEVAMSRAYLDFANDLSSGMLDPKKVDRTIVRDIARPDPQQLLAAIAGPRPAMVLHGLAPKSPVYAELMKTKLGLEASIAAGGWGPTISGGKIGPGDSGPRVVALRDRLIRMGYLEPTASRDYDGRIRAAVLTFQQMHGLPVDGVAGESTVAEINVAPEERLKSVIVGMERERWMGDPDKTGRIIWVNLPDMTAKIVDDGRTVFRTRSVIGREDMDRRTPEFSDMMAHMVVNPSWGVPRSIIVGEYLPLLQRNPNAVSNFQIIDRNGRVVPRGAVNFAGYTARSFPYGMRQPPGDANALGKVKFMFPNVHNIYLHDTPSKSLFAHDRRAYSHGCIRLADPFEFAHVLFSTQSDRVEGEFNQTLKTGRETTVKLEKKVPIHLVYFTAYPEGKGWIGYRRDVYDRDTRLWSAMTQAGVVLGSVTQ